MCRGFKSYLNDTAGNFAMMTALFMGILVFAVGAAIELSRMVDMRSNIQGMADAAALAGAFAAKNELGDREGYVRQNILINQQGPLANLSVYQNAVVTFNDETEEVTVQIPVSFPSFFSGILGEDTLDVSAQSIVSYKTEAIDPVTIAFALDVSGSMGWGSVGEGEDATGPQKIEVLEQSIKKLFEELKAGSPNPDLLPDSIRTGWSAYNTEVVDTVDIAKGWEHLITALDAGALVANGGTNSTPALTQAHQHIIKDRKERTSIELLRLREYVIFMTDGDNNDIVWDEESSQICLAMRNDGIEIYSIAFSSPEKGEVLLLDCASWNDKVEREDDPELEDFATLAEESETKCENNGAQGKGKALGHCDAKKDKENDKSNYYFDANDAETFKAAFARIGREIANLTIRVKS